MPLMRALSSWFNRDHEGMVDRGDEFETSEYRAAELVNDGLAAYAVSETEKTKVTADPPPPEPDPDPEPDPPVSLAEAPRKAAAKKKGR